MEESGPWAPLIIIGYTVLSHVFAPLSGSPAVLLALSIFGIVKASIYLYIASLISATINFWIARHFGRRLVKRFVGQEGINNVDQFTNISGGKFLIIARVFGFSIFEIVSYAAGLTNISFKKYLAITTVFNLIPSVVFMFLFRDADFSRPYHLIVWFGSLIIAGFLFTVFVKKHTRHNI